MTDCSHSCCSPISQAHVDTEIYRSHAQTHIALKLQTQWGELWISNLKENLWLDILMIIGFEPLLLSFSCPCAHAVLWYHQAKRKNPMLCGLFVCFFLLFCGIIISNILLLWQTFSSKTAKRNEKVLFPPSLHLKHRTHCSWIQCLLSLYCTFKL